MTPLILLEHRSTCKWTDHMSQTEGPFELSRPRGYKTFFMLNSVQHEILNAHKY